MRDKQTHLQLEASRTLDLVKVGIYVHEDIITRALFTLGDLGDLRDFDENGVSV